VTLPATALVDQMFASLIAKGRGAWDHAALITLLKDASRTG
jgi:3-hydroxyisobutyrate dehydrogenase-like beta-hydroxyacid dehydrogenase